MLFPTKGVCVYILASMRSYLSFSLSHSGRAYISASTHTHTHRYEKLVETWKPPSEYPAYLHITDIAGLVRGAAEGAGLGNAFLSHIMVHAHTRDHMPLTCMEGAGLGVASLSNITT